MNETEAHPSPASPADTGPRGPRTRDGRRRTGATFRRLRAQLTILIAGLLVLAVGALALFVVDADRRLRDRQIESELLRLSELISASVGFDDGELQLVDRPAAPAPAGVVLAQRGEPTPADVPRLDEYVADYEALGPRQRRVLIADVVRTLAPARRGELATALDVEDGETVLAAVLRDPPEELVREARRRYLVNRAVADGVVDLPAAIVLSTLPESAPVPQVLSLVETAISGGAPSSPEVTWNDQLAARVVPIRDGVIVRGAAAVFIDRSSADEAHATLRFRLGVAVALAATIGTAGAWWIAGRAIRPAEAAVAHEQRFLADAAHELRTPLASIRSTAERGLGAGGSPDGALTRVVELAGAAGDLTDDLLTLARMDAGAVQIERRPVRLDLLVEALVDGDPAFELDLAEVTIEADTRLVERAVDNLLTNARRHGMATAELPATVVVTQTCLVVADRGPGIEPEFEQQLFERFTSGSRSSGHGLGLALVAWVATAHGWTATATQRDGGGARFEIDLHT